MVYSTRRFVVCLTMCHFVLVFFSPFSIAITSLGEERANLSAFRTFVRFVLVWICRFSLPLGVWEGLRFEIVALPGLFSYPFLELNYRGKVLVFRWELIMLLLLQICLFFCHERDFKKSLSRENQGDIIEAFNSTSRYPDNLLSIDSMYFEQMVDHIYPTELQLKKTILPIPWHLVFDLHLCISNGTVLPKVMINGTILILI